MSDYIKYSDLIKPDDSFSVLVANLEKLEDRYSAFIRKIEGEASRLKTAFKDTPAVSVDDTQFKKMAADIQDLTAKYNALIKEQTTNRENLKKLNFEKQNAANLAKAQGRANAAVKGSYDQLSAMYAANTLRLRRLTKEQRASTVAAEGQVKSGAQMEAENRNLKARMAELEIQQKKNTSAMARTSNEVREYNQVTKLKAIIDGENANTLERMQAQYKLNSIALSKYTNEELKNDSTARGLLETNKRLTVEITKHKEAQKIANIEQARARQEKQKAVRMAELELAANTAVKGSYDQLSAQYSLNKIKLNAMSVEMRELTTEGKLLTTQTREMYEEMDRLQQVTGKHTLSVGNYAKGFNGLNNQVNMLTRELPALAINANLFLLAISNNIPYLIDEFGKLREANRLAVEEGKTVIPASKQIARAFLSWQTAMSIGVALMTIYGGKLIEAIGKMKLFTTEAGRARKAQKEFNEATLEGSKNAQEEIAKLNILVDTVKSETKSREEKLKAVKYLKKEYKEHLANLTEEEILAGKAAEVFDLLSKNILKAAKAQAYLTKMTELYKKVVEAEFKISDITEDIKKLEENRSYIDTNESGMKVDLTAGKVVVLNDKIAHQRDLLAEYFEQIQRYSEKIGIGDIFDDTVDGVKGSVKGMSELTNELQELERKLREVSNSLISNEFERKRAEINESYRQEIEDYQKRKKELEDLARDHVAELTSIEDKLGKLRNKRKYVEDGVNNRLSVSPRREDAEVLPETNVEDLQAIDDEIEELLKEQQRLKELQTEKLKFEEGDVEKSIGVIDKLIGKLKEVRGAELVGVDEEEINFFYDTKMAQLDAEEEYRQKVIDLKRSEKEAKNELTFEEDRAELELEKWKLKEIIKETEKTKDALENISGDTSVLISEEELNALKERLREIGFEVNKLDREEKVELFSIGAEKQDEALRMLQDTINAERTSVYDRNKQLLAAEKEYWVDRLELMKKYASLYTATQLQNVQDIIAGFDRLFDQNAAENRDLFDLVGLNLEDFDKEAITESTQLIIESIGAIIDAKIQAAEKAVEAAEKERSAAESVLDYERQARAEGYASQVSQAERELVLAKKQQEGAIKQREKYQKQQELLQSAQQASNLITATSNILASTINPIFAIPLIALMWGTFAAAKIKAAQVSKPVESYGEGTYEILKGGSHASGNDIPFGVNSKGAERRVEGGEAFAVFSKKSVKKYGLGLRSFVNALNKGTIEIGNSTDPERLWTSGDVFQNKYLNSYSTGDAATPSVIVNNNFSTMEDDIRAIREQGEQSEYRDSNGRRVVKYKNLTQRYAN